MTNSIEELENTDLILATGTNTTENHPVIAMKIKRAVRKHGAKMIVIDPREIDLVKYADIWLRQNPGTDVAVFNGLMNVIIAEGLEAKEYIAERTEGFDALKAMVAKYTPDYVEKISGVPAEDLQEGRPSIRQSQTSQHHLRDGPHPAYQRHGQREEHRKSVDALR